MQQRSRTAAAAASLRPLLTAYDATDDDAKARLGRDIALSARRLRTGLPARRFCLRRFLRLLDEHYALKACFWATLAETEQLPALIQA